MIEFAAPALGGLVAVAAPILVHIAHRRRFVVVEWGAMRFLKEMLAARRRQLSLDHLLLLATRMAILACVALALARPQLSLRAAGLGDLITRSGRTAAIVLIDDSASTAAPRGAPAFARMKQLAHAYLGTLKTGDEVSIVPLSRLGEPPADPLYDLAAAHAAIDQLQPTAVASDQPALIEAGLDRIARHLNPEVELALITDGRAEGFAADERERWDRLRARLRGPDRAAAGTRARPHLLLLSPRADAETENFAVTAVRIDRTLLPPGRPVAVRATVALEGPRPISGALARLLVDGRTVSERPLDLQPGESRELVFTHDFPEPGSYLVEVAVEGARDALPDDDRRGLAVEVEARLPVLLVESHPGTGLDGSLGLLAAALVPEREPSPSALYAIERCGMAELDERRLSRARVVVLGDVPALEATAIAALERFVVGGGGILVVAGAGSDHEIADRFWWRAGDGFLAAPLGPVKRSEEPLRPVARELSHPALEPFTGAGGEAWREVSIIARHPLDPLPPDATALLTLEDGSPLLVERARGRGRAAVLGIGLDGQWSDLPYRAAFVPLARSLIAWLGGTVLPSRNLLAGERLAWFPTDGSGAALAATAEGPDGQPVPLSPSAYDGHPALLSAPLVRPGAYRLHPAGAARPTWFEVGVAPSESRLAPLDESVLADCLRDLPRHAVSDPERVRELFTSAGNRTWELWRGFALAALALLVVESLLTRRAVAAERTAAARAP